MLNGPPCINKVYLTLPYLTPLVNKLIHGIDISGVHAIKWGKELEADAIKQFMAVMTPDHDCAISCLKACGLLVKLHELFLAASPVGFFICRCCSLSIIEAESPYSIREQKITENYSKTDFLEMRDGSVKLKTSHKFYSHVTMLMAITQAKKTYFVVWTTKDLLIEKIEFSADHWN